jgi:hypothetical protein
MHTIFHMAFTELSPTATDVKAKAIACNAFIQEQRTCSASNAVIVPSVAADVKSAMRGTLQNRGKGLPREGRRRQISIRHLIVH